MAKNQEKIKREIKKLEKKIYPSIHSRRDIIPADYAKLAELEFDIGHYQKAAKLYETAARNADALAGENVFRDGYEQPKTTGPSLGDRYRKKADEIYDHLSQDKHSLGHTRRKESKLAIATAAAAVIGLIGGIFFLSANLTGNVIGNLTSSTSNTIGVILLVVGLIAGFLWIRNRKR